MRAARAAHRSITIDGISRFVEHRGHRTTTSLGKLFAGFGYTLHRPSPGSEVTHPLRTVWVDQNPLSGL